MMGFDIDNSGSLSFEEFCAAMQAMRILQAPAENGDAVSHQKLKPFFDAIDSGSTGQLTFEQLRDFVMASCGSEDENTPG